MPLFLNYSTARASRQEAVPYDIWFLSNPYFSFIIYWL